MSDNTFENVKILDNFYQTSSFFPMPVVLVGTVAESGKTNLGPYSLIFPFKISEDGKRAMKLNCRAGSNTAKNILRTGVCSLNFIPDDRKYMKNCVMLGFPGETTEEKMAHSIFTLQPSTRTEEERDEKISQYPAVVEESIQVFECSIHPDYPPWIDEKSEECHIVLLIDKIAMKKKWKKALFEGKRFPPLPIDYGYRNNQNFWFTKHSKPYKEEIPKSKGTRLSTVIYAVERFDPTITWEEEACKKIVNVPRIFLNRVIEGVVNKAKEEGITVITPEFMDRVRDKRSNEKEE